MFFTGRRQNLLDDASHHGAIPYLLYSTKYLLSGFHLNSECFPLRSINYISIKCTSAHLYMAKMYCMLSGQKQLNKTDSLFSFSAGQPEAAKGEWVTDKCLRDAVSVYLKLIVLVVILHSLPQNLSNSLEIMKELCRAGGRTYSKLFVAQLVLRLPRTACQSTQHFSFKQWGIKPWLLFS